MCRIVTVALSSELADFVDGKVDAGDYQSVDEVVSAALALMREHDEGLAAIRAAIEEGEASGEPQPFDFDAFLEEMHRRSSLK
jgi:antitoxin ParD1/3/4